MTDRPVLEAPYLGLRFSNFLLACRARGLACAAILIFGILLVSCSLSKGPSFEGVDSNLPVISDVRFLPDVTSIALEWDLPKHGFESIRGYLVYRKNASGEFERIAFVDNNLSSHYYDKKLSPQTEYTYALAVVSVDSKTSRLSRPFTARTSFIDAVDFVHASEDYAGRIKIFWSPSPNPSIKNYLVQRLDSYSGEFLTIGATDNRLAVEYFDSNLEPGVQYSYRVIAVSYDGANSLPSKEITGRTRALPPTIQGLDLKSGLKSIEISWEELEGDIKGYNIWASDSKDGKYAKLGFVTGSSYEDDSIKPGFTRYYKVTAMDKQNLESKLQEVPIFGELLVPLPKPVVGVAFIDEDKKSGILEWVMPSEREIDGFMIYRRAAGEDEVPSVFDVGMNTEFIDDSMQPGVEYYYVVEAVSDELRSASEPVKLLLPATAEVDSKPATPKESGEEVEEENLSQGMDEKESKAQEAQKPKGLNQDLESQSIAPPEIFYNEDPAQENLTPTPPN